VSNLRQCRLSQIRFPLYILCLSPGFSLGPGSGQILHNICSEKLLENLAKFSSISWSKKRKQGRCRLVLSGSLSPEILGELYPYFGHRGTRCGVWAWPRRDRDDCRLCSPRDWPPEFARPPTKRPQLHTPAIFRLLLRTT
jgi:hypothetical protein